MEDAKGLISPEKIRDVRETGPRFVTFLRWKFDTYGLV